MESDQKEMKRGKLYYHSCFRSNRCIWLLREIRALQDYELIDVDVWNKTSDERKNYTKHVHPHTTIPALEYDGKIILESGAICMFLVQKYPELIPVDLIDYYNLMFYVCATVDEVQERLFVQYFFNEPQGTEDKDKIEKSRKKFETCLDYIGSKLKQGGPFICGKTFTVVDCVLGYNIWWASVMKEGILQKYPELTEYLKRLGQRPAFQKTFKTDE